MYQNETDKRSLAHEAAVEAARKVFAYRNKGEMAAGEWVYARRDSDGTWRLYKPSSSSDLR